MSRWAELFTAFENLKALVIGDLMLDAYLFGQVDRISPEAPVPVVLLEKKEYRPGGAANVALNLRALGAGVSIASVTGDDTEGSVLRRLLEEQGIETEGLFSSSDRRTTVKHRIIGNRHQMLRIDEEDIHDLNEADTARLLEWIRQRLQQFDVIIFEDYDKGVLSESLIHAVIDLARKTGIPTVVDPKKRNFLFYRQATLFKPNLKEIREGLKLDHALDNDRDLDQAVRKLMELLDPGMVMVTLSERGVWISDRNVSHHIAAHIRNIADVSGAGDTVVSVAALALAAGAGMDEIAILSNLAGGLVCEKVGVVPVEKAKLLAEVVKLD